MAAHFVATPWTVVIAAQEEAAPGVVRRHLNRLCETYWPPVYAFLRQRGHDENEAADITQGFFSDVVLGRDLFLRASEGKGRLRSWLLTALQNYRVDVGRQRDRIRTFRLPEDDRITIESGLRRHEGDNPSRTFDRQWAAQVLNEGIRRTQQHFADSGRRDKWLAFERFALAPLSSGNAPPSQTALAAALGMSGATAVSTAVRTVRQHLRLRVEDLVAETTAPAERTEELAYLLGQLGVSDAI